MITHAARLDRRIAITWGLRQMGIPTRDALVLGADLENCEHPLEPDHWPYLRPGWTPWGHHL